MKNFYYVLTFNLTNYIINKTLNKSNIRLMSNAVDFKIRSKLYATYSETMSGVYDDFSTKFEEFDIDEQITIKIMTVMNPHITNIKTDAISDSIQRAINEDLKKWDENCCAVAFFSHVPDDTPEDSADDITPESWLMKYEIFYTEDVIELPKNGDFMLMNVTEFNSSTYH